MKFSSTPILLFCLLLAGLAPDGARADDGVIRLGKPSAEPAPAPKADFGVPRSGFDHRAFEGRLEALWFQRKGFLANGRLEDADRQADRIVALIDEEGIQRVPSLSGALLAEARRAMGRGEFPQAEAALDLALRVDPDRPQIRLARADLAWKSGLGPVAALGEAATALRAQFTASLRNLTLVNRVALVLVLGLAAAIGVLAVAMLIRHQSQFRLELVDIMEHYTSRPVAGALAWGVVLAPLLSWFAVGWAAFWWIVITIRYMGRQQRLVALGVLVLTALLLPGYEMSVALYSMAADPQVRATVGSAERQYDPDRVLKIRRLVEASPQDPVYRFLLAGLYREGRYYEEAFAEYSAALELDPDLHEAHVNIGNIFYVTGQYGEAATSYLRAIEMEPRSPLPFFNLHLAQSEALRFTDAEQALATARRLAPDEVADWLSDITEGGRPQAQDATLQITSVWQAALSGRMPREALRGRSATAANSWIGRLLHPLSGVALLSLAACGLLLFAARDGGVARKCMRCGDPFRPRPGASDGPDYCTQCHHLFIKGEGLAPGAKQRKLYEVQRHEAWSGALRRVANLVLPGSGLMLRGRFVVGLVLVAGWCAALVAARAEWFLWVERAFGLDLRLDLLAPAATPTMYGLNVFAVLAVVAALVFWLIGNLIRLREA